MRCTSESSEPFCASIILKHPLNEPHVTTAIISPDDIDRAALRIADHVRRTPAMELEREAFGIDARIVLKLESLQHTGSFKPRGAFNRMLTGAIRAAGVIAASGGNHGAAVAYAAAQLGTRAEIFVPTIASAVKVARLREYGAQVHITGRDYSEALAASTERANESGALVVHAYDQPEVIAGQGTTAKEFEQQAGALDTVLVAVGGGGFIGGIAAWFGTRVRVIGVEPERARSLHAALGAGAPVEVEVGGVAADSLGARRVGDLMFDIARCYVPEVVLVSDAEIQAAQRALWQRLRFVAEPGGAAAFAAVLSGRYRPKGGERVGVFVCGGNADLASIAA